MPKKGGRGAPVRPHSKAKKARFHGNRYSVEAEPINISASAEKLRNADYEDVDIDTNCSYVILHFTMIFGFLSQWLVCSVCGKNITFGRTAGPGIAFKLTINCDCETRRVPSSPQVHNKYEVNQKVMFAARYLGLGQTSLTAFFSLMDIMHTLSNNIYYGFLENLLAATKEVFKINQKKAVAEEVEKNTAAGNEPKHLSVSGDGTWKKRGFSSLFGVSSLIGKFTGKILDVVVKSAFCQACANWEKVKGTAEYILWHSTHEDKCSANHIGSAGKMEVDAISEMFSHSNRQLGVKYKTYIGDGDTKTFKALLDLKPYEDLIVQKKECIGHVQKRMGTRLRNLKKNSKGLGGKGKLTDKLIKTLTLYYGLAIRRHPNSKDDMRKAIWATFYHKSSTDEKPQHHFCPEGVNSWCKWRVAEAEGTLHTFKHEPPISEIVINAVRPVYESLTEDDLLERCTGGNTQNSNESFNSTIWRLNPKHLHCANQTVEIATYIAANIFNEGFFSVLKTMNVLGISVGLEAKNYATQRDKDRIAKAEGSISISAREALMAKREKRAVELALYEENEGTSYGAGIAD